MCRQLSGHLVVGDSLEHVVNLLVRCNSVLVLAVDLALSGVVITVHLLEGLLFSGLILSSSVSVSSDVDVNRVHSIEVLC